MNDTALCSAGLPGQDPCTGRGQCVAFDTCECDEGWTGRGDFVLGSPTCAFNIQVVRGLYGLLGCISTILLILSIIYLLQNQAHQRRKDPKLFWMLAGSMLGTSIPVILLGFYRTRWPDATFGTDIFFTINYALGFWSNSVHVGLYYYSLAVLVFREARAFGGDNDDTALRLFSKLLLVHVLFALVAAFVPLTLFAQTQGVFNVIPSLYLAMHCLVVVYIAVICVFILTRMAKTIRKAVGKDRLSEQGVLRTKLMFIDELARYSMYSTITFGGTLLLFASWTQLRIVGFTYLLPVLVMLSILLVIFGLIGLINFERLRSDIGRCTELRLSEAPSGGLNNNTTPFTSNENPFDKTTLSVGSDGLQLRSVLDG